MLELERARMQLEDVVVIDDTRELLGRIGQLQAELEASNRRLAFSVETSTMATHQIIRLNNEIAELREEVETQDSHIYDCLDLLKKYHLRIRELEKELNKPSQLTKLRRFFKYWGMKRRGGRFLLRKLGKVRA